MVQASSFDFAQDQAAALVKIHQRALMLSEVEA
jgi:hypothetical protein